MYQCFHCLEKAVIWDCDYSFEDFGYEGEGIVHICHCSNCGAEIEYRIPLEDNIEKYINCGFYNDGMNQISEKKENNNE